MREKWRGITANYETAPNISQSKEGSRKEGRKKYRWEPAIKVRSAEGLHPLVPTYLIDGNGYDIRQISFNVVNFFWPLPCTM